MYSLSSKNTHLFKNNLSFMIAFTGVTKSYTTGNEKITILNNFDLSIQSGEFVAIMGPSGSGKSTLLGLAGGIISPDSGTIEIGEVTLSSLRDTEATEFRGANIAYIFQSFELISTLTVRENIELPLDINKSVPRAYGVEDILARVGLTGKGDRYPDQLSGGERQRVAIARAFIGKFPYLYADEPTGNLDRTNAERVMDIIAELHAETGNTILMITHDPLIGARADRVVQIGG
jgi:putative ABC transport system ATP-binding protein